jgi:hypothetical protein
MELMLERDDIIELYCVVIVPDMLEIELFIEPNCELTDVFIELSDELKLLRLELSEL